MKRIFLYIIALVISSDVLAQVSKAEADSAYAAEDFARAAQLYCQILDTEGESAEIYYNLGNSYFRLDSIGKAILNYERAYLLNPSDADIRFNLELARKRTTDKVAPRSELFFTQLYHRLVLMMSIRGWAMTGVATFILMLIGLAFYIYSPRLIVKQIGFGVACVLLIVCIFSNVAAAYQRNHIENRTGAIIMAPFAIVKSTPSATGNDLFNLHEGTRVDIIDDSMREWVKVQLTDGKEGWLERSLVENI